MDKPLVSVIIPTYNRSAYLREALASVVSQTYPTIEILVIDDGSKQNYAEAICAGFFNCNYHYKRNGGPSSARNFGIGIAKGDFIAFLDDDDFWKKDKLEQQVNLLMSNSDVDLIHSPVYVVDEQGNSTGEIFGGVSDEKMRSGYVFWNALGRWLVKSATPLIRKEVFSSGFLFDEDLEVGEDVDFYQRLFYKHKIYFISEPLAYYRVYDHENRLSAERQRYVGMELKMFNNFKKMGIRNPILLYRIARRLLRKAIFSHNVLYPNNLIKRSTLVNVLNPVKGLSSIAKKGEK